MGDEEEEEEEEEQGEGGQGDDDHLNQSGPDPTTPRQGTIPEEVEGDEDIMPEVWSFSTHKSTSQSPKTLREMVNGMRGVLDQIRIPIALVGSRYSALVHALLEHDIVAIGLYRPPGIGGALLPFTLINPDKETKLTAQDQVFILRRRPSQQAMRPHY